MKSSEQCKGEGDYNDGIRDLYIINIIIFYYPLRTSVIITIILFCPL